jgi:hypothetical protein
MAARKRFRRDDGIIVPQSVVPQDVSDPNVARLTQVLLMLARGKTHVQIAIYFEKDVRTIQRWIKRAREMGLAVSSTITPQDMVNEINNDFLELKAAVLDSMMQAKAENNNKLFLHCIKALRDLEVARIAALARIGYFDNYTFPSPYPPNPRVARAEDLLEGADNTGMGRIEGPTNEGDDGDD